MVNCLYNILHQTVLLRVYNSKDRYFLPCRKILLIILYGFILYWQIISRMYKNNRMHPQKFTRFCSNLRLFSKYFSEAFLPPPLPLATSLFPNIPPGPPTRVLAWLPRLYQHGNPIFPPFNRRPHINLVMRWVIMQFDTIEYKIG